MFRMLIEVILNLLVQIVTIVGLLLRWLPSILVALRDGLQWFLFVSCDAYRGILRWLQLLAHRVGIRIRLMDNPWRLIACVLLSLLLGVGVMVVAGWDITPPGLGVCTLHGVIVAVVWDQMGPPSGIRIGIR